MEFVEAEKGIKCFYAPKTDIKQLLPDEKAFGIKNTDITEMASFQQVTFDL